MGSVNDVKQFGTNRRTHAPYLGFPPKGSKLNLNKPTDLIATATGDHAISLTWIAINACKIERSTNGYSFEVIGTTARGVNSFDDSDLSSYTQYYYRVCEYIGSKISEYSEISNTFTLIPHQLTDSSVVSFIKLNTETGNFYSDATGKTVVLFDDFQNKGLSPVTLVAWSIGSGWTDLGSGRFQFSTESADGAIQQIGNIPIGIYKLDYEIESNTVPDVLWDNVAGNSITSFNSTVGVHSAYFVADKGSNNFAIRHNRGTGALVVKNIAISKVLGNHLYTKNNNYFPVYNQGASYNVWVNDDFSISFATDAQSVYVVAKKTASDLDFKVYTDLTGIGELSGGVLTLGANAAKSSYYKVIIKYVVIRNTDTIEQDVINYLNAISGTPILPRLLLPSKMYAVVGTEFNLFSDSVSYGTDANDSSPVEFTVEFTASVGSQTGRKFSFTPESSDIGNHTITCIAKDKTTGVAVETKSSILTVIANTSHDVKNINMIGDSITATGVITKDLYDLFTSNKPNFIGAYNNSNNNKTTGFSGNDIRDFLATNSYLYKFLLESSVNVLYGSVYSIGGNNYALYICENNNIWMNGTVDPPASGTLTKVSGTGPDTIDYTSFIIRCKSPFLDDSAILNIPFYRTVIGGSIDYVTIQLGGAYATQTELSDVNVLVWINNIKTLCDALLADNNSIKILINLTLQDKNNPDGWGTTFPTSYLNKQNFRRNVRRISEMILQYFDNSVYNENVYVGISALGIDRVNYEIGGDSTHPVAAGLEEIARAIYPQLLNLLQS